MTPVTVYVTPNRCIISETKLPMLPHILAEKFSHSVKQSETKRVFRTEKLVFLSTRCYIGVVICGKVLRNRAVIAAHTHSIDNSNDSADKTRLTFNSGRFLRVFGFIRSRVLEIIHHDLIATRDYLSGAVGSNEKDRTALFRDAKREHWWRKPK